MTPEEADAVVTAHFLKHRIKAPGLNRDGLAGALVEGEQLLFEHDADAGTLRCSALIYRFRDRPHPGLIDAVREAARHPENATGGAGMLYVPDRMTLSLARQYTEAPTASAFERDQAALREACAVWRKETFARVAEQVRHPERR